MRKIRHAGNILGIPIYIDTGLEEGEMRITALPPPEGLVFEMRDEITRLLMNAFAVPKVAWEPPEPATLLGIPVATPKPSESPNIVFGDWSSFVTHTQYIVIMPERIAPDDFLYYRKLIGRLLGYYDGMLPDHIIRRLSEKHGVQVVERVKK
jgi:hypothetical protein